MRARLGAFIGTLALLGGLAVVASAPASAASTLTWTGGGTDSNWSTPANWSPAQAPVAGDSLSFPPGVSKLTPHNDLPADTSLGTIALTGSGYTLTGNSVSAGVDGSGQNATLDNTISLPMVLGQAISGKGVLRFTGDLQIPSTTIISVSSGDIVISGAGSGSGRLLVENFNGGRLLLSGSNFAPLTSIDSGTVVVDGNEPGPVDVEGSQSGSGTLLGSGTVGPLTVHTGSQTGSSQYGSSVSPGDPVGVLRSGDFLLGDPGVLALTGTGAAPGQFDQLAVTGTVTIYGDLQVDFPFQVAVGQKLKIIDNDGTDAVTGTFAGLPEGSAIGGGSGFFKLSYVGGDGNDVVLTSVAPPPVSVVTGPGSGGGPNVKSFGGRNLSFFAGQPGTGGASVAAGNVLGGDLDNIVVGSGAGVPSRVIVYNQDGSPSGVSFSPYGDGFTGGVNVGVADIDGDGVDEIVTGAGAGGGPNVRVFAGDGEPLTSFFAYDAGFHGGVTVAGADVTADGIDEIVTGPGPGGGPNVKALSANGTTQWLTFTAYSDDFHGGVNVAGVDVDGDGRSEIVTGPGPGGGPHVRVFGRGGAPLGGGFFAFDPGFTGGVFVGSFPDFGRQHDDILVGAGPGGGPNVKGFLPDGTLAGSFFAYDAGFHGGVRVAGAVLNAPQ